MTRRTTKTTKTSKLVAGVSAGWDVPRSETRLIVCGTRTFSDQKLLRATLDRLTKDFWKVCVVSGASKRWDYGLGRYVGADRLGEEWAFSRRWRVIRYHADWDRHGKQAGPVRNSEMVDWVAKTGGYLVAFWDGESDGTRDVLRKAKAAGNIRIKVIRYE